MLIGEYIRFENVITIITTETFLFFFRPITSESKNIIFFIKILIIYNGIS